MTAFSKIKTHKLTDGIQRSIFQNIIEAFSLPNNTKPYYTSNYLETPKLPLNRPSKDSIIYPNELYIKLDTVLNREDSVGISPSYYKPVILDPSIGLSINPIYTQIQYQYTLTFKSKSKVTIQNLYNDLRMYTRNDRSNQ